MTLEMGSFHTARWPWVVAALSFAAVTALRVAVPPEHSALTMLYAVPVVLAALRSGAVGGVLTAAAGLAVFCTWAVANDVHVGAAGYLARAVAILALGGLAGYLSTEHARAGLASVRWFEMSNDLLVEANLQGRFTRVSPQWERHLGWSPEELTSRPMLDFVHPDDVAATRAVAERLDAAPGEVVNFENRYRTRDGSYRWLLWSCRSDEHRKYAVARDITDRKALEQERQLLLEQVAAMARTDPLTGLPNRRSWDTEVERAMAHAQRTGTPLTLAMVDLDRFKAFNDGYGHQAGDALLVEVAAHWSDAIRSTDFLARYGGEEFGVLLPGCPIEVAFEVVERMRAATPHDQTCSGGLALWDGTESPANLVARADAALYEAKATGRDRIVAALGPLERHR